MKNLDRPLIRLLLLLALLPGATAVTQTEKGRLTVGAQIGNLSYQTKGTFNSFPAPLTLSATAAATPRAIPTVGLAYYQP